MNLTTGEEMKTLYIYHPGTGTVIPLSDEVYLVNSEQVSEDMLDDMSDGLTLDERDHKGYRIDNYNMTNLFFGE
jgi:hypothetical protein